MNREVLKSYFAKQCSPSEKEMVELWLQNPENQAGFEQFLESYWEEHVAEAPQTYETIQPAFPRGGLLRHYMPRVAAVAAVLAIVFFSVRYFTQNESNAGAERTIATVAVEPKQVPAGSLFDTGYVLPEKVEVVKPKSKSYAKRVPPQNIVSPIPVDVQDTIARLAERPKTVKMVALTSFRINDSALAKLNPSERLKVLNQIALNVNFRNAGFRDIAVAFREKYGILLELCADAKPDKLKGYTASFSNITLPDLIQDMSSQMMFSYTVSDKVVKVCFN